jgi:hypothetical protein
LIFISGLLACFSCDLNLTKDQKNLIYSTRAVQPLVDHLCRRLDFTPLESLANTLLEFEELDIHAATLFQAYDDFVGILANNSLLDNGKTPRDHLDQLPVDRLDSDLVFQNARKISHRFRNAVHEIFLRSNTKLSRMTIDFGVF